MKKKLALAAAILLLVLSCAAAELVALSSLFDLYKEHYSVKAVNAAQEAEAPLPLTEQEKSVFMLGFAAGYDHCRMLNAGQNEIQYVLNIKSMKFHTTECSGGKSIKDENKRIVTTPREELIEQGYVPCQMCNP